MEKNNFNWKIAALLLALLLLTGALAAAFFVIPGSTAPPVMPEGEIVVSVGEDGKLSVSWPEPPEGVSCRLYAGEDSKHLRRVKGAAVDHAELSGISPDEPFTIRVTAVAAVNSILGIPREAESDNALEVTIPPLSGVTRPALDGQPHPGGGLDLSWKSGKPETSGGTEYEICTLDEDGYDVITSVKGGSVSLTFGPNGDLTMPEPNRPVKIAVRMVRRGNGYRLCGPASEPYAVDRDQLLGGELLLDYIESGERMYTLLWNESRGDYYEVQEWDESDGSWDVLWRVNAGEELSYETGRLDSGSSHKYRVVSYGDEKKPGSEFSAGPSEVAFRAAYSPLYATVWPILDQPLYQSTQNTKKSGQIAVIPGGTALCVLEEKDGFFSVRYQDNYGWVDSRFCMINLPEYTGDLCAYNITNSYSSVFKIHDYDIENITGQVIKGFENVQTADGAYLVPFLYPSAKKLILAAEAAEKDGYRLKIYEAYRPNEATRFLYDTTLAILNNPVPDWESLTGDSPAQEPAVQHGGARSAPETDPEPDPVLPPEPDVNPETLGTQETPENPGNSENPEASEPEPEPDPKPGPEQNPAEPPENPEETPETDPESGTETEIEPEPEPKPDVVTYGKIMTDGRFRISAFLAASVSNHNRGVALDLTLETLPGCVELEMQSAMHDLSWHAAAYLNNDNAKLLERYMKDVGGMAGLTSEWWHFQDDAARSELKLTGYLAKGVSAEGWKRDDNGWRYRNADGSYQRGSFTVDGKQYASNAEGYVAE